MENHNFGTGCNTNSAELFKESLKRVAEMERRFMPQKGIVPTCDSMCAEANKIMVYWEIWGRRCAMREKKRVLKPDTVLKNYWNDNERFADFFNAVLFHGEQRIFPEELEELDTEESTVLEHREYAESIAASRDSVKVRKKSSALGVEFVILGMENQGHIHYAMPMRVMGYDYGFYKKQYDSNAKRYKTAEGLSEDEYLSKMRETDKLIPVITVVVYYGEKPWNGAASLHGMLNIPEEVAQYVNDYKIILVEARQNEYKFHNVDNKDFFNLLRILLDNSKPFNEVKEEAIEYTKKHDVEKAVVMTVAGAANCKLNYELKGDGGMWTVFEETQNEGRIRGIIEMGIECGLSEEDILEKLEHKLNVSRKKAQEYFQKYAAETV
nr:Rpn family recombination-promoting nuclease/putative transposase [uncultured Acetatifactor sp.]